MKLEYNGFDLGQLGKLIIAGIARKGIPEEAPNRFEVAMRWRVNVHESTFTENFALCEQARAACRRQHGTLKWTDDTGKIWLNQSARISDVPWPESPNANAGGTYYQAIEGTFVYIDTLSADESAQALAVYTPNVEQGLTAQPVTLGAVVKMKLDTAIERQGEYISNRESSKSRVTMGGRFLGNPLQDVATRQAALIAQVALLRTSVQQGFDGTLNFATLFVNQFVRVTSFWCDVDEAQEGIDWNVTFQFTEFPDESGYAQASFVVAQNEDKEAGTVTVDLRGSVASDSETRAREKWSAIRQGVFAEMAGYVCTRASSSRDQVDGADGPAFVRINFEESWRKTVGSIFASTLKIVQEQSVTSGFAMQIYSGQVTATGVDYDTAFNTALARAKQLGDNKGQVQLEARVEATDRQRLSQSGNKDNATATDASDAVDSVGAVVWVTLEFSYTYRTKGTRLWIEMTTAVRTAMQGEDREEVSGFCVAADLPAMQAAYKAILDLYDGRMVSEQETSDRKDQIGEINLTTGAPTVNKIETATRRDFRFSVFKAKAAGEIGLRYELEVVKNWRENEKTTSVRGTIWASDANVDDSGAAGTFLTAFLASLGLSGPVNSRRVKSAEQAPRYSAVSGLGQNLETVSALAFEEVYVAPLSAVAQVLQSSLREELQFSGDRVVVQDTADSTAVIQVCGTAPGTRSLRGMVVATNETAALIWIKQQALLPLPAGATAKIGGVNVTSGKAEPLNLSFEDVFVDMKSGVARDGAYGSFGSLTAHDVKMVRGEFTLVEHYEELSLAMG